MTEKKLAGGTWLRDTPRPKASTSDTLAGFARTLATLNVDQRAFVGHLLADAEAALPDGDRRDLVRQAIGMMNVSLEYEP